MRFACQSCGKAYNLPEDRIADKSNVKLKCRVCGAIVEVKKQGELVAQVLDDADGKRMVRVSEAPAPLTSISPEDDESDGATVSISESSINDEGPLQLEMPAMPPAAATGFATASLGRGDAGGGRMETVNVAPPLPPPPLSPSSLPPPPPLRALDAPEEGVTNGSGFSANGVHGSGAAGSNGSGAFFPEVAPESGEGAELLAPVSPSVAAGNTPAGGELTADATLSPELPELPTARGETAGFKVKMAAAFITGALIDRILSGLFN